MRKQPRRRRICFTGETLFHPNSGSLTKSKIIADAERNQIAELTQMSACEEGCGVWG